MHWSHNSVRFFTFGTLPIISKMEMKISMYRQKQMVQKGRKLNHAELSRRQHDTGAHSLVTKMQLQKTVLPYLSITTYSVLNTTHT